MKAERTTVIANRAAATGVDADDLVVPDGPAGTGPGAGTDKDRGESIVRPPEVVETTS